MKSILFTSCLLLTPVLAAAESTLEIAAEVRCREISFSRSVELQDPELFASFIDADARFVSTSVLRGPAAVTAAWAVFFASDGPRIKWRPQFVEVLEDGALALSRGPYRMLARNDEGTEVEYWGTFNSVWRLQSDGSWRVVFDAGSESSAAPPEPVRALLDQGDDCP